MKDFRTLAVWQRSHELTLSIYELSRSFPKDELFGITSQIRRASGFDTCKYSGGLWTGFECGFVESKKMPSALIRKVRSER